MTHSLRRALRALVVLPVLAALTALVPSTALASSANAPNSERQVTLMTRNLYLGADLLRVVKASDPITGMAQIAGIVEASNPPQRMAWVANEIKAAHPDVVALQEVADWHIAGANPLQPSQQLVPPAQYDFLALLLSSLQSKGTPYHVVVTQENFNSALQLPEFVQLLATYSDRDVILVRDGASTSQVKVLGTNADHFVPAHQMNLTIPLLGAVNFNRGYEWADIKTRGKDWRIVNTHPEAYSPASLGSLDPNDYNGLQMQDLAATLSTSTLPTVVIGDLNSKVGDPSRAGYANLIGAGFADSWLALGKPDSDVTCCRDERLETAGYWDERIDHVLLRGMLTPISASHVGVLAVASSPAPPPYWPSDHAGVVTTVSVGKQ